MCKIDIYFFGFQTWQATYKLVPTSFINTGSFSDHVKYVIRVPRPNKIIPPFPGTCQKKNGSVGQVF